MAFSDEEVGDYQVPISTKPLPREKISDFRQTVQSIHQSFCEHDYGPSEDTSLRRSEQVSSWSVRKYENLDFLSYSTWSYLTLTAAMRIKVITISL